MLYATLLLALSTCGGASLTYLYDPRATLTARLAAGACVGMAIQAFIGYALALRLGLSPAVVALSALLLALPLAIFAWPDPRVRLRRDLRTALRPRWRARGRLACTAVLLLGMVFLALVFKGVFFIQEGAIGTTDHHNIGDLPWHLAIVQGFAVGGNYPPQDPEFGGSRLTYPFLADFVAAELTTCGASLPQAFLAQNLLLSISLLVLLIRAMLLVTRSLFAALVAPAILFLSGGWGWVAFLRDWRGHHGSLLDLLTHLPQDYTLNDHGLRWGNVLTTLLMTQRSLLFGVPLALVVLTLLWQVLWSNQRRAARLAWAGGITGVIPLCHGYTFPVVLIAAGAWALGDWRRWRDWVGYFALAGLLALPQALALSHGSDVRPGSFLGWQPGWDSGGRNFLLFWYDNTGPLFPLLIIALLWRGGRRRPIVSPRLLRFYLPFTLFFLLPNLFRFAPWAWDNMKILVYWFLGTIPLLALVLARCWRQGRSGRVAAVALLVTMTLSGALDVWRATSGQMTQQCFGAESIAYADLIQRLTPPQAVILQAPAYNHPLFLSGRGQFCAYGGHLWSHGYAYETRAEDAKRIYAGGADADALLARYGIRYLAIGPPERNEQGYQINDAYLSRFRVLGVTGPYRLLAVP
jgi:hypothetical protein